MTTTDPETSKPVKPARSKKPAVFKVMEADHIAVGQPRKYFETASEREARKYVTDNHPRGSEVVLVHPDGFKETYEPNRLTGEGGDHDEWLEYDKEDYE